MNPHWLNRFIKILVKLNKSSMMIEYITLPVVWWFGVFPPCFIPFAGFPYTSMYHGPFDFLITRKQLRSSQVSRTFSSTPHTGSASPDLFIAPKTTPARKRRRRFVAFRQTEAQAIALLQAPRLPRLLQGLDQFARTVFGLGARVFGSRRGDGGGIPPRYDGHLGSILQPPSFRVLFFSPWHRTPPPPQCVLHRKPLPFIVGSTVI